MNVKDKPMTEEEWCHEMLSLLRFSYQKDAQPYLDRLVRIQGEKPVQLIVGLEEFEKIKLSIPVKHEWPVLIKDQVE